MYPIPPNSDPPFQVPIHPMSMSVFAARLTMIRTKTKNLTIKENKERQKKMKRHLGIRLWRQNVAVTGECLRTPIPL
ncbi:hypothetical protein VTJ04DRAFT_3203 [Mycothermus thermophilus]|uniref:uncharacterized protein n=1 Tax=Humicola insolens TaxID=85995 RepID=UPI00374210C3